MKDAFFPSALDKLPNAQETIKHFSKGGFSGDSSWFWVQNIAKSSCLDFIYLLSKLAKAEMQL